MSAKKKHSEDFSALLEVQQAMVQEMQRINVALEQSRAEVAQLRQHINTQAVEGRDKALLKVERDVDSLRALIEDGRTPAEQGKDAAKFANVLRAPGIRAATADTFAARARVGRAAKKAGMGLAEWTRWCETHGWEDLTVAPSPRERSRAENRNQTTLFEEDEPKAPTKPRGRPKGKKDSKPRKKRASKKKTATAKKKTAKKATKKKVSKK